MQNQSADIKLASDACADQPASLWQRIISSWLHTYELACVDGGKPFLML